MKTCDAEALGRVLIEVNEIQTIYNGRRLKFIN